MGLIYSDFACKMSELCINCTLKEYEWCLKMGLIYSYFACKMY